MAILRLGLSEGDQALGVNNNLAFLKVISLGGTNLYPTEYVLSTTQVAISATEAELTLETVDGEAAVSEEVFLDAGTVLHFGATTITVAEDAVVDAGGVTVAIAPAAAQVSAGNSHAIFGMVKAPAAEITNWNQTVNNVDAKLLGNGEQASMERASVSWEMPVNLIVPPRDAAYYRHIKPAADKLPGTNGRCYLFAAVPADNSNSANGFEYAIGQALVNISGDTINKDEIRRPTATFTWCSPYRRFSPYEFETTARKAELVTACKLAGVAAPTA